VSTSRAEDNELAWLDMEELDRDLYRADNESSAFRRRRLYGGQVAAQALRAAGMTVPDDRLPHSLHGYFLRAGAPQRPVIFRVDRDRDGRSFSARRVAAIQNGEVIFEMTASFQVPEESPEYRAPIDPTVAPPDPSAATHFAEIHPCLDVHVLDLIEPRQPGDGRSLDRLWARARGTFTDSPIIHACLVTFMSDLGSGFGTLDLPGLPVFGPSIDHAVWFQSPVRADDWVLFDAHALKVGGSRGLYMGSAHDREGRLGATFAQEMLLRPKPQQPD
jgi:acyl-CoA thioesterase II